MARYSSPSIRQETTVVRPRTDPCRAVPYGTENGTTKKTNVFRAVLFMTARNGVNFRAVRIPYQHGTDQGPVPNSYRAVLRALCTTRTAERNMARHSPPSIRQETIHQA